MRKLKYRSTFLLSFSIATLILICASLFFQIPKLVNTLSNKATKINDYKNLTNSLLGLNGKKNILILFMNNAEQRYGGGFIGSVGYMAVENGKIKSDPVKSVYYYDRYLSPKSPMPKLDDPELGPEADTLRNSGQNLSWVKNGRRAKDIFKAKTGKDADMVIGLTPEVLKLLLEKIGPVYLPEYSKEINSQNIIEELQTEVEFGKDKVEGKDPKSILSVLANKIIERISNKNINDLTSLGESLKEEIIKKQILFYSPNIELASSLERLNFDGSLARNVNDFLMIEEFNQSIDKSNAFIDRDIKRKINIDSDGKVSIDMTITRRQFREKSLPYVDPKDGFTYLIKENISDVRIAVPKNSTINEVEGNVPLKKIDSIDYVDIYEFRSTLMPLEPSSYKISYSLPTKITKLNNFNFDSCFQMQNGGWPYSLSSTVEVPIGWELIASSKKDILINSNEVTYINKMVDRDVFLSSVFAKK